MLRYVSFGLASLNVWLLWVPFVSAVSVFFVFGYLFGRTVFGVQIDSIMEVLSGGTMVVLGGWPFSVAVAIWFWVAGAFGRRRRLRVFAGGLLLGVAVVCAGKGGDGWLLGVSIAAWSVLGAKHLCAMFG